MSNTLDRSALVGIPGIAELYESYLSKTYKALISIASDPEREPVYLTIVETNSCEEQDGEHGSAYDTHHEPRAVEPPQTSHAAH